MECLYAILEVDRDATHEEIKRSYRNLALKYHPDKMMIKDDMIEDDRFIKIKEAYEILVDPIKRNIYDDNKNKMKFDSINEWKVYVNDIVKIIYSVMRKNIFPDDITIKLQMSILEIYHKKIKKLSVKVKRWVDNELLTSNETIYVDLVNFKSEYIFIEKGDSSVFKGIPNSNIVVRVSLSDDSSDVHISDLLSPYDLYIDVNMSLKEFYTEEMILLKCLPHIEIKNDHRESYILKSAGLPYLNDDMCELRGDIYVKINIRVPVAIPNDFIDYIKTI